MTTSPEPDRPAKFNQEEWLDAALDALSRAGRTRLHLDSLIAAMPVSKGSFYHHFHNRHEFLEALAAHWTRKYNLELIDSTEETREKRTPEKQLWDTLWLVTSRRVTRFEPIMRSLALENAKLASVIRDVEERRFRFVSDLLRELGFEGADNELRTRGLLALVNTRIMSESLTEAQLRSRLQAILAFFLRP